MEGTLHSIGPDGVKNVCVIVPTYNNSKTLRRVLDDILNYTPRVIVVNDGSSDDTAQILAGYPQLNIIHFAKNSGKGSALRAGFKKAIALGYTYAITIDSDGQHFAADIPLFLAAQEEDGNALLIGSRNMAQEGVPKKSSFGNKFSNFWFWFETGIRLSDTQSGYRMYPLQSIPGKYFTPKFEFEIEVIVRSAWKGVPVKNIPVRILYDPSERVSHFRPFRDFTRISILNTVLVAATLLYIKPRDYFANIKKKGVKQFLLQNVLHNEDSNTKKALSISLGAFIAIAPIWGFQTVTVLILATVLRLNKAISFAFSHISMPPFIPIIIYSSFKIMGLIAHTKMPALSVKALTFSAVQNDIQNYLLGSIILASVVSVTLGVTGYLILSVFSVLKNKK